MEQEIWKDVPNYDGDYKVSNFGKVKSFKHKKEGKLLKNNLISSGYLVFGAMKNGKRKSTLIHVLVCELFNDSKPTENHIVNHRDGNKQNNHYLNLEWVSRSENSHHAYNNGLMKKNGSRRRKVVQKNLNGEIINKFESLTEAAKAIGSKNIGIFKACNKNLKTYKGYIWDYANS
ncbi:NUMOD4 domain-containing protein [Cytobacillus praedii]|uniref:NUMOD4 domain-containing protein n=1 Tax=Cytobacillus praedii TaxID=1742358 RepID=UPI002E1F3DBE|nr:NUMOD4 domain-containing protein [Cytobacillus praedii]MED3552519.1 NUMOD4 domain-containing protein [Cytobacillus praedii]